MRARMTSAAWRRAWNRGVRRRLRRSARTRTASPTALPNVGGGFSRTFAMVALSSTLAMNSDGALRSRPAAYAL
jgi:hypothetical protein